MARARQIALIAALIVSVIITIGSLTEGALFGWARAPLLMPIVVLMTLLSRPLPGARVLVPLLAAQVFSWFGDIALASEGDYFVLGVGMFLLAQVSYIVTFLGIKGPHQLRIKPVVLVPYLVYYVGILALVLPKAGELALPLVVYGTTLTAMAVFAMDTWPRVSPLAARMLLFGSILFVTSDSLIALTKFDIVPDNGFVAAILIGTYCAAQVMLALGVLGSVRADAAVPSPTV